MKMQKCRYLKNVKEVLTLTCFNSCEQKRHTFQETYTAPVIGLNHVKLKKNNMRGHYYSDKKFGFIVTFFQ